MCAFQKFRSIDSINEIGQNLLNTYNFSQGLQKNRFQVQLSKRSFAGVPVVNLDSNNRRHIEILLDISPLQHRLLSTKTHYSSHHKTVRSAFEYDKRNQKRETNPLLCYLYLTKSQATHHFFLNIHSVRSKESALNRFDFHLQIASNMKNNFQNRVDTRSSLLVFA